MRVGNDICEVKRFYELVKNKKFLEKVFSEKEQEHIFLAKDRQKQAERMAGKFAAKEATLKAFGLGIGDGIEFLDIEILPNEKGSPQVFLRGEAQNLLKQIEEKNVLTSISNTQDYATAVTIIF